MSSKRHLWNTLATLRRQPAGFHTGKSCGDHIVTHSGAEHRMYLIFIDYEKPFDRINHKNMQGALRRRGVPLTITCFILLGLCMHSFVFVQSYNHTRMYATTATDPYRNQRDFGRWSTITTSSSPPATGYDMRICSTTLPNTSVS